MRVRMSKDELSNFSRWVFLVSVPVAAAALIGIGTGVWGTYKQVQNLETSQKVWQSDFAGQLRRINGKLEETYPHARGEQIERQVESLRQRIIRIESRLSGQTSVFTKNFSGDPWHILEGEGVYRWWLIDQTRG